MTTDNTRRLSRGDLFERVFTIERAADGAEGAARSYRASLSSEQPVERWFGTEVLSHAPGAIDMVRAGRGLPLLFNHDMDEPIGKVDAVRLEGGRLVGDLRFSPNSEKGPRIQADVDAGFLGDVSIRYSIDEYTTTTDEHGHDTFTITRWTPLEASIVTVPADPTVGVGRSHKRQEGITVTNKTTATGGNEGDGGSVNVVQFQEAHQRGLEEGAARAAAIERARIAAIDELFAGSRFKGSAYDALRAECVKNGTSLEQARAALLALINTDPTAAVEPAFTRATPDVQAQRGPSRDPFVQAGNTAAEKLAEGLQRGIEFRAGMLPEAERRQEVGKSEFISMSLSDMARAWCEAMGINVRGKTRSDIVGLAFTQGFRAVSMGTVDFAGILANVASKALLKGWDEAPETWNQWCRIGNLADFKRANRTGLSQFSRLDTVGENQEYEYGKFSDRTEYIQLVTYGKLFAISRQAIINDDLNAFTRLPMLLGRAANGTVGDAVYNSLTTASGVGPTLNQDSLALFHSTHANYDATSGGITVTNLDAGRVKMGLQADPNSSAILNIRPKHLLVPITLQTGAEVLVASAVDPDGRASASGGAQAENPFRGKLNVIAEGRLDGKTNGTTAWYLLADQNMHDTYEVAFLDGRAQPTVETRNGWNVDGAEMKVSLDAGVAALDFRGMYRKRGA